MYVCVSSTCDGIIRNTHSQTYTYTQIDYTQYICIFLENLVVMNRAKNTTTTIMEDEKNKKKKNTSKKK